MTSSESQGRGNQEQYNMLLQAYGADTKRKRDSINYLMSLGFSPEQAENAVHVYFKGGDTTATLRLTREKRNELLDNFDASHKAPKDAVNHLMGLGYTYRQATSAVYLYRLERHLISS